MKFSLDSSLQINLHSAESCIAPDRGLVFFIVPLLLIFSEAKRESEVELLRVLLRPRNPDGVELW